MDRPIVRDSHVVVTNRMISKCFQSRTSLNRAVILGRLPDRKLREYEEYPLAHRIGLMHAISEDELDIGSATITDVGFLGLFPKKILECLKQYAGEVGRANQDKEEYMKCVTNLITAFVYRPLVI